VLGTLLSSPIAEIRGVRKRAQGNARSPPRFCTAERFWLAALGQTRVNALLGAAQRPMAALLLDGQHEVARVRIVEHRAGALVEQVRIEPVGAQERHAVLPFLA